MSVFKSNKAIITLFALSLMISASDTQAQTGSPGYTENNLTVSIDVKGAFDLANQLYPGLFRTPSILREYEGYVYRYYRDSGNYIGIKDGKVFLMGANFGGTLTPTEYGSLDTVLGQLKNVYRERFGQDYVVDVPDIDIPEGDFTLTITGRYESTLISINLPAIILENMPAPDPDDIEPQLQLMRDQGVQNIRNVKVTTINNSSSRVTFDLEFQADVTALGTVTYRLNYDYVK